MQVFIRGITGRLYDSGLLVGTWRRKRMESFLERVDPPSGARILDLGGSEYNWELIEHDFDVTIVNLPGNWETREDRSSRYKFLAGDATNLRALFEDGAFDVVFSNSVIEHVGPAGQQKKFSDEVKRLAPAHWIQTPSIRFPLEPHTGVLFFWRFSAARRQKMMRRWRSKLPSWVESIENLRVLTEKQLRELFPDSEIFRERVFLFEKSYTMYRPYPRKPSSQ